VKVLAKKIPKAWRRSIGKAEYWLQSLFMYSYYSRVW